jgi:hypothetical protein
VAHQDRTDPDAVRSQVKPVGYRVLDAHAGAFRSAGRLLIGVDTGLKTLRYEDVGRADGSIESNADRDRSVLQAGSRLGYEFSPGYSMLVRVTYDTVNYDLPVDDRKFDRDSKGLRATAGIALELTRLLTGEVFAGYMGRICDDPGFATSKEPTFGMSLVWSPSGLTTVRVDTDRRIEETAIAGLQSRVASSIDLRIEHELTRQIMLSGGVRRGRDQLVAIVASGFAGRRDISGAAWLAAHYQLNRRLYLAARYERTERDSRVASGGFDRSRLFTSVGARF